jgi:site-specific DNA recombinase
VIAPATVPAQTDERAVATRQVPRRTIRCAVYCRVSTDEQAALEYNSLQAQEDFCKTYLGMRSRDPAANERWEHAQTYVDSGLSGGTLERPALNRLLADIEAGLIDVLLIYKIDRLSRSIHQFYRIWEVLERREVDLVSATQDLNTTTSQGKLMLNMLLSFGQYERELVGERTRDKIAASRRRGRWTGGTPILGYDIRDGRLVTNEGEAFRVREVFRLYLEHPSLTRVVEELNRRGWTTKSWTRKDGGERDGRAFDKPALHRLLVNPLYAGKVRSNGSLHAGEHRAIVDEATWNRANAHLRHNGATGGKAVRNKHGALLRGLLYCNACGCAMTHSFTNKGGVLYRYYVCVNRLKKGAHACPDGKIAAHEAERQVLNRIREIGKDPELIAEVVRQARAQLDQHRKALEAEQRQLGKDLKRERASLRRLASGHSRNGEAAAITARLAAIQQRIETVERRLVTVAQDLDSAKQQVIYERQVAAALSAFDSVWDALIPVEQARILGLLTERIGYYGRTQGLQLALRPSGIGRLHELQTS